MCSKIAVMYLGKIIEFGYKDEIFNNPKHPYTIGLLKSVPRLDEAMKTRLDPIDGMPPDLVNLPSGCSFAPRCKFSNENCLQETPVLKTVTGIHMSACLRFEELDELRKEDN